MKDFTTGIDVSIQDYCKNNKVVERLNDLLLKTQEDKEVYSVIKQLYGKKYK